MCFPHAAANIDNSSVFNGMAAFAGPGTPS